MTDEPTVPAYVATDLANQVEELENRLWILEQQYERLASNITVESATTTNQTFEEHYDYLDS